MNHLIHGNPRGLGGEQLRRAVFVKVERVDPPVPGLAGHWWHWVIRMPNGSLASGTRRGRRADAEAFARQRVRQANARVFGKVHTDYSNFRF